MALNLVSTAKIASRISIENINIESKLSVAIENLKIILTFYMKTTL